MGTYRTKVSFVPPFHVLFQYFRWRSGLSYEALGRRLGIARANVRRYAVRQRVPTETIFHKLVRVLELSPGETAVLYIARKQAIDRVPWGALLLAIAICLDHPALPGEEKERAIDELDAIRARLERAIGHESEPWIADLWRGRPLQLPVTLGDSAIPGDDDEDA